MDYFAARSSYRIADNGFSLSGPGYCKTQSSYGNVCGIPLISFIP